MAKKVAKENFEGGIGSLMNLVNSFDKSTEVIADSVYSNIENWIPSGNYILNACMSGDLFKAIPEGRIITFAGPSATGKSFLATNCAREAQKLGYIPIFLDSEGAYNADFVRRIGVDPQKAIIKQVNTILETSQFIVNLCEKLKEQQEKTGQHDKVIIILDSLGNLTSDKERADTMSGEVKVDFTKAKDTKAMFRVCATPLAHLHIPLIVCNHTYSSVSFIPQQIQANGSGIVYNASVTIELSASKLEDSANEKAAKGRAGSETVVKNGVMVTAKPTKSRFCRPMKVKFQIPYWKKMNEYLGLETFLTWENSGIMRGSLLTPAAFEKLSDKDKEKIHQFEYGGKTMYAEAKDTARTIVVKHLGEAVPILDFFTPKVFTQEFLEYINENVIHPMFQLPDQSSFEDIEQIETLITTGADAEGDIVNDDFSAAATPSVEEALGIQQD